MKKLFRIILLTLLLSSCVTANVGKTSQRAQLKKLKDQQYAVKVDKEETDKRKFKDFMFWSSLIYVGSFVVVNPLKF